jgi:hypothetical protein
MSDLDTKHSVGENNHEENEEKKTQPGESKYAVFAETNGKHFETWYTFIKIDGNEAALEHLQKQLERVDWYIIDDLSTFDLDLDHTISAQTAKEMTKIEINSQMFHRKYDGVMKKVHFNFDRRDGNEKKIVKAFKRLGIGAIDKYLEDEDVDVEDLQSESESDTSDDTDYEYEVDTEDDTSSGSSSEEDVKRHKKNGKRRDDSSDDEDKKTAKPTKQSLKEKLVEKLKRKMQEREAKKKGK